ncbi:methylenetetrahydrofolate reductase-domain-containing protein [Suillus fuscotomentosus]|uniref:Methylenetetrahydrofolate reductase-domain-containing protein n=1 Tax=Suillus fuscotomentosus TaxID=1912939 RepID=A0AAD4HTF6_9AGAM|nr:methylenetetrahydrofolate reductase-domain-containing protein [Suillus fuscotomentosus]KAG1907826.1 methylenetetrahydrofolate reductase-domain-containing protein [Suillus fuscotomentosus]
MRISKKIEQSNKEGKLWWSFEYFPPRTAQGLQNLLDRIKRMTALGPEFIDITWNAGGRTSDLTAHMVKTCQGSVGVETCMHLTCTNMPKEKVDIALQEAKKAGCRNVLALRGDPPQGKDEWEAVEGGFIHGIDLVKHIHNEYGDYFDIAVAGFPQFQLLPPAERDLEMKYLKEKVDAGVNFIFTQMFYDVDVFIDWVNAIRAAGITIPIVPGIAPIQTWNGFLKATSLANTKIPQSFLDALEPYKNDDEKVREIGTKLVADMCRKILAAGLGIQGLHFYTMNLEKGTKMLLEELNLTPRVETIKPLPWRQSLTPNRRQENIRPIFWANRADSYLSRTENWDEFPNGRFGDSRSPAYGELDGYGIWLKQTKEEALKLWGEPKTFADVASLFSRFCLGSLKALPWSNQAASSETSAIALQLAKMNELGFLTINSQPAVNGARSDDPQFGWGPSNGYVYQKAYLEFFVGPQLLELLIAHIERDSNMTYYVINKQGDLRTNTHSDGPNAVTWGVFPGKEIVQPTVVEALSFMAWKDEAYELGVKWANIYEAGTPSRKLMMEIFESSCLVNVVHNDFKDSQAIFEPFFKAGAEYTAQHINGNGSAAPKALPN